ncbi:MAG: methyltransferase domain-containing protein [Oscillochloris sp.]|nr:methyltransferase domain-containing protein [Oscillochloris sp.]
MDHTTITTYDLHAERFAADQRAKTPQALYQVVLAWFLPAGRSADLGCGSGRDTAWLNAHGFQAVGYDASAGMLAAGRAAYPHLDLRQSALPDLAEIADGSYDNLLCSAVLMHLPPEALARAPVTLARVLRPGGRVVLTYRASREQAEREHDGRLYTAIDDDHFAQAMTAAGLTILWREHNDSDQRSDVRWHVVVAERSR